MYFHTFRHELVKYQSAEANNPMSPKWEIPLMHSYVEGSEDFNTDLRAYAETIPHPDHFRKDSIDLELDGYTSEETNRIPEYNFLDTDNFAVQEFKNFIRLSHDNYIRGLKIEVPEHVKKSMKIQCWVNILPPGEAIKPHNHYCGPNSWISGNYCVNANKDTYTAYYSPSHEMRIANQPGMLTLFPSYLSHYTNKYMGNDKRITIAFDIFFDTLSQWSGEYEAIKESFFYAQT